MMNKINSLSSLQNSLFCYYYYAEVVAEIEKEERGNLISVFNPQLSTDYNWQESLHTKLGIRYWNHTLCLITFVSQVNLDFKTKDIC